jgi:hypothetical protein
MKLVRILLVAAMLIATISAQGNILWEYPLPQGLWGSSLAAAGDVNGDGVPDVIAGWRLPFATGSATVFSGYDGSVIWTFYGPAVDSAFGDSVAAAGDVDGDGYADVVVGAWGAWLPPNPLAAGSAHVYSGATGVLLNSFTGSTVGDHLGYSVSGAVDYDGDGLDDVLVGATQDDTGGYGYVKVYSVLSGATIRTIPGMAAPSSPVGLFGRAIAVVGDVDGDAVPDLIIGNPNSWNCQAGGAATVHSGANGSLLFTISSPIGCAGLGEEVAGVGDVDGDGVPDVAAATSSNGAGTLVASGATGAIIQNLTGEHTVSGLGDVDGDGTPEVLVGKTASLYSPGAVWTNLGDHVVPSWYVAGIGDINGDGIPDLAAINGNAVQLILVGLGYQNNSPAATLDVDGLQGSANVPAGVSLSLNTQAMLTLASTNTGMPWELGFGVAPLVPQATGAFTTVGGQILSLDLTDPTFGALWGYFQSPGFVNATIPFSVSNPASVSVQMLVVSPTLLDGVAISQPTRLIVQ